VAQDLDDSDRLPEGYPHGAGGSTSCSPAAWATPNAGFVAYPENEKPGYLQLGAWVKDHTCCLAPESVVAASASSDKTLKFVGSSKRSRGEHSRRPRRLGLFTIPVVRVSA
jgi:hypothetical protein